MWRRLWQHLPHGAGKSEQDTQHDESVPSGETSSHVPVGVPLTIPLGAEGCRCCLPCSALPFVMLEKRCCSSTRENSRFGEAFGSRQTPARDVFVCSFATRPGTCFVRCRRTIVKAASQSSAKPEVHRLLRMIPGIRCCRRCSRRKVTVASNMTYSEPRETF